MNSTTYLLPQSRRIPAAGQRDAPVSPPRRAFEDELVATVAPAAGPDAQRRVAIARSLAMNPEIMLFDEITAALDPETVKEVLFTIRELVEDGMTGILVTHEMGFAREIANHIYFTDRGVIVEHGPPKSFFADAKDPRTKEFLSQIL